MVGELEESKRPVDRNRSALVDAGDTGAENAENAEGEGGDREGAHGSDSDGDDQPTQKKKTIDVRKIEDAGECSSSDGTQVSSESEGEQYVEDA